jgi:hypothetical protein
MVAAVATATLVAAGLSAFGSPANATSMKVDVPAVQTESTISNYSWGPVTRHCLQNESCRVRATGGEGTQRHFRDGSQQAIWFNHSATQRTSWHGSGSQQASVTTEDGISGASATCICQQDPCASKVTA